VIYTSAPLYHVMGNLAISLAIEQCGSLRPQFSTSNFFRREREIGATMAFGIGWLAKTLLAQSESPDDKAHQLHTIYMGLVSEADRARFLDRFGVTVHSEILGQPNAFPSRSTHRASWEGRARWAGRPIVSRCSSWMMKGSLSIPARSAESPSDRSFRGPIRRVLARQREDQQLRARLPRLEPARRSQAGQGDVRAPPFVCRDRGVSPQQIALAWELAQAPVVIPISGAKRPESIRDSAAA
jgi:hypothetical protein